MANSELLPCPFCGATPVVLSAGRRTWALVAHKGECLFPSYPKNAQHEISDLDFDAWNTRAETRAERDLRDELNWMHAELHGAETAASGETVLLDEQYSHAMRLVEELHQVLSLNGGGYLDEFGSQADGGAGAVS